MSISSQAIGAEPARRLGRFEGTSRAAHGSSAGAATITGGGGIVSCESMDGRGGASASGGAVRTCACCGEEASSDHGADGIPIDSARPLAPGDAASGRPPACVRAWLAARARASAGASARASSRICLRPSCTTWPTLTCFCHWVLACAAAASAGEAAAVSTRGGGARGEGGGERRAGRTTET